MENLPSIKSPSELETTSVENLLQVVAKLKQELKSKDQLIESLQEEGDENGINNSE